MFISAILRARTVIVRVAGQIPDGRLKRSQPVFQSWAAIDISEADHEAIFLRQAIADADWDTVERHGGCHAAVNKILQWDQESPASNGREMIDDFRLWGSRRCRRMGGHLTTGGWRK